MKNKVLFAVLLVFTASLLFPLSVNIRSYDHSGFTRIVFQGDRPFEYQVDTLKNAIDIKLKKKAAVGNNIAVMKRSKLIDRVVHRWEEGSSVFRVHMKSGYRVKRSFVLEQPFRLVFDLVEKKEEKRTTPPQTKQNVQIKENKPQDLPDTGSQKNEQVKPQQEEPESESPEGQTKKRVLIDTICIDPGHGGTDLGAVGRTKLTEKEVTLNVSKKLKRLIVSKLGLTVVMTRESDEEVSLNSRVSKANNRKAQLFISIHVNSSFRKSARGPETYYVSLKATDQEAFQLSQKENSSFEDIEKMTENDDLKMILWNMAQTEYIKESSKLADFIQFELNVLMHTRNRGVKQAPFRVLMRAAMPAVLVEISFISNRKEEKQLQDDSFLAKVASAIYDGISKYIYYHNNLYK
jgi:N-acetylmuramoyl-L-alanine amidase